MDAFLCVRKAQLLTNRPVGLYYFPMNQTVTPKGQKTRDKVIATAAQLFHRQGYHNTGLRQILTESGVTKGAFYFHFKDKKSLALDAIDFFQQFFMTHLAVDMFNQEMSARARLESFHLRVKSTFGTMPGMAGCPLGNMTLELAGIDTDFQIKLDQGFRRLTECFAQVIEQGQDSGEFTRRQSAESLAEFIVCSWEGSILRMKSAQSLLPLDHWFESIMLMLVKDPL